uniref:Spermatogenesis-associated protein 22-like n=1 Tax=Salmo trutta TaxID=8032 RepID=A0A673Z6Q6_SALTR
MKRYENQQARPTAGCLSVPLFNQKKRSRLPLTSNPSEKKFCSGNEYMPTHSSASSIINTSGKRSIGYFSWTSVVEIINSNYNAPCSSGNTQSKPVPPSSYSQMGQQQLGYRQRQDNPPEPPLYSQQSKPTPPPSRPSHGPGPQKQNTSWKFITTTNTGPQKQLMEDNRDTYQTQNTSNSLRILTAVIDGIRHWSHFKDRAPYLFEIFATLDSAVTAGSHGAKNFLMRDGKEVVQCVFYENELELPRLIRGQVHRCVGNYDCTRDTLTCVSVRAALPSEQRNAQESIKASDAEMRDLVKSLSEV